MTLEDKYWAAGFLDGTNASPAYEKKNELKYAWKWNFSPPLNNDLLVFFRDNFGAKIVRVKRVDRYDPVIRFTKTALVEIIEKIGPYLRNRREVFEKIAQSGKKEGDGIGVKNIPMEFPAQEFDARYQKHYAAGVFEASAAAYISFHNDDHAKFGATLHRSLRLSQVVEKLLNSMEVKYYFVNHCKKPEIRRSEDIIKVLSYAKNEIRFRKELVDYVELIKEISIPAGTPEIKTSKARLPKEIKKQIEKEVVNEIIDYYIKEAPDHDKIKVEPYLNHGFKNEIVNGEKIKVEQRYEHYRVKKGYSKGNYLYKYFSAKEEAKAFAKKRNVELRHEKLAKINFGDPEVISIIIRQYSKYVFPEHKATSTLAVTKEVKKRADKHPLREVEQKVVYNRFDTQAITEKNERNRRKVIEYNNKVNSYVFNESLMEIGLDGKIVRGWIEEKRKWIEEDNNFIRNTKSIVRKIRTQDWKNSDHTSLSKIRSLKPIAKRQLEIIRIQFSTLDRIERNLIESTSNEAICRGCKKNKPKTEFTVNKANHHGVSFYCKCCVSEKGKLRQQDPAFKEKNHQYYLDHKEERLAYAKEYSKTYVNHKDDYDKYIDRTRIGSGEEFWNSKKEIKHFEITVHRGVGLSKNDFFMHLEEEWRLLPAEIKDYYELPHELTAEEIFELRRKKLIEIDHIIPKARIKALVQQGHARGCEVHPHHGLNLRPLPKELNCRRSSSFSLLAYYPNYKKRLNKIHRAIFQKSLE